MMNHRAPAARLLFPFCLLAASAPSLADQQAPLTLLPIHVHIWTADGACAQPEASQRENIRDLVEQSQRSIAIHSRGILDDPNDPPQDGLNIIYRLSPAVAANTAFVQGLELAADIWEAVIDDPINLTMTVDFTFGQPFIAATGSALGGLDYGDTRDLLIEDASTLEGGVISSLPQEPPTFDTSVGLLGFEDFGFIVVSTANAKALGLNVPIDKNTGLQIDSSIVFNTDFNFDPTPDNGLSPGSIDLVFVMVHELGHALGFISGIDRDPDPTELFFPFVLDLYRFGINDNPNNPASLDDFSSNPREFRPGVESALDTVNQMLGFNDTPLFSTGPFNGDGRQTSHWKDDQLIGLPFVIGVMDPTYSPFQNPAGFVTQADLFALSLIGWDINYLNDECFSDLTRDGVVNAFDLAFLLASWPQGGSAKGDLTGNAVISGPDLATMLGAWGPCP